MINWSKKVSQESIARLYNQSASGICSDELVDEVGWALYARCESIVSVTGGFEKKRLLCPKCGGEVPLTKENSFDCPCGFCATWDEFRASYKNKQLYAANALPIFKDYQRDFPRAKTYGEKLICIDMLIHSFHIKNSYDKTAENYKNPKDEDIALNRPTGANLIEGSLSEVILFLDKLSSIEGYSKGKEQWRNLVERANGGKILAQNNDEKHFIPNSQ
ncbi:MAG: hypothetical protein FWH48_06485 [Oscillospiraceae bacterium]|nr:hypothetical protein [Oscillospiraceae bacterium]